MMAKLVYTENGPNFIEHGFKLISPPEPEIITYKLRKRRSSTPWAAETKGSNVTGFGNTKQEAIQHLKEEIERQRLATQPTEPDEDLGLIPVRAVVRYLEQRFGNLYALEFEAFVKKRRDREEKQRA